MTLSWFINMTYSNIQHLEFYCEISL